jgi:dual specificity tyrosine-phosphorylation-regulated kinase 2/3/4
MAQTEINLLVMIREKDPKDERSIMRVKDFFTFRNHIVISNHIQCIVSELLSINLFEMLRKTQFKGMHIEIVRKITIQLMTALAFLKGLKIIHGDIKPENIVLKEFNKTGISSHNSGIKLIDFGTSIFKTDKHYDYLMSRYYRAPEVILGSPYDEKIDMWSAGCVLAEIYTGKPLFPGENEQ